MEQRASAEEELRERSERRKNEPRELSCAKEAGRAQKKQRRAIRIVFARSLASH
jgi:hypothetical protein